jgi:2-succinyl-5-enolpyruvyl-6-hydroxy-3-cyclohexene-1-carboxylate synthase
VNRNTVWARVLVEELARAGVSGVCMAPGSRSTPLVLAAAGRDDLRIRVFIDERSAAFFALGLGRATGRPAAVITTSGTAVANLLPATVEASQAEVPLLLLTADRPPRLRDADANQTIPQAGLLASWTRWRAELPEPEVSDRALRHLRVQACRAVAMARGLPAGPVHLDVPFEKPLEPVGVEGDVPPDFAAEAPLAWAGRGPGADASPFTAIGPSRPRLADEAVDALVRTVTSASRGVLVAGPHPEARTLAPALRRVAAGAEFLLLADPLAGARWPAPDPRVPSCTFHDLWLGSEAVAAALRPDLVVRLGAAPTSAAVQRWLAGLAGVPQLVIDAGHRYKDHLAVAHEVIRACPVDTLRRVADRMPGGGGVGGEWTRRWLGVDAAAGGALEDASPAWTGADHEGRIAAALVGHLDAGTPLFVSSSMPIRDVDAFGGGRARALDVYGNRGASGIDGIVSTALGVAAGTGAPTVALVGDLALLHDVNGLLATREPDAQVVFVVVNNDGGGIFHMLPIADYEPDFTPYFATPHGILPERAAALYELAYRRLDGVAALPGAVATALDSGRSWIFELRTDRAANRAAHADTRAAAEAAAEAALDAP